MHWCGNPTSFSYIHPFIVAYEPSFIEIRHVESGQLQQVLHTTNLRVLSVDPVMTHCVMDNSDSPYQHIFKLKQLHEFSG
jgi:RHO1 GDP-GTP exchange protein 1/2